MMMRCPNCNKRAFDVTRIPSEEISVELKCPRCNQIVLIPCNYEYIFLSAPGESRRGEHHGYKEYQADFCNLSEESIITVKRWSYE